MVSIKSHWARTNLNMPTYYDFADETKLLDHPATISDAILPLSNASNARSHFNCCERKILSDYDACLPLDQVNCVKVFARHPICYKCVPCIIDLLCQKQHLDIYMYYLEDSTLQCKKLNIQSYWMNLFHKNALKNELIAQKYRDMVK